MGLAIREAARRDFSGEIILPEDKSYEQARATYTQIGTPALVMRPRTANDVGAAIQYAQDNSLILSVRSGGHSVAGLSTNKGGLVIDLVNMRKIEIIDLGKGLVRIEAGATWGEVAAELQKHQLALSSGDTKSVGVGGLTLGGGIGWMVRKYGLAIDSVAAAEVVTADGRILRVSATENPDLFWAIRGGGGNFGIVTHFEFAAHPLNKVFAGTIAYGLDNLSELLRTWRDYMRQATEDLSTSVTIMPSFGGAPPAALIMCCCAGADEEAAARALEPLRQLGAILWQDVQKKNYADVLEEAHPPEGIRIIAKNVFAQTLSDDLIQAITATLSAPGGRVLQIRGLGGAMKRIDPTATAFPYRDSEIMLFSGTFVSPAASEAEIREALKPWETLAAYGRGAYANFLSTATDEDVAAVYSAPTYERLAKIKAAYDPQNLFNQNHNIKPSA
jgi:FAD/FMN-containing dehydrogenase